MDIVQNNESVAKLNATWNSFDAESGIKMCYCSVGKYSQTSWISSFILFSMARTSFGPWKFSCSARSEGN